MSDPATHDRAAVPTYSCLAMARAIAATRGHCNRVSVWRAIQRLQLEPVIINEQGYKFYSAEQLSQVREQLRTPNAKA